MRTIQLFTVTITKYLLYLSYAFSTVNRQTSVNFYQYYFAWGFDLKDYPSKWHRWKWINCNQPTAQMYLVIKNQFAAPVPIISIYFFALCRYFFFFIFHFIHAVLISLVTVIVCFFLSNPVVVNQPHYRILFEFFKPTVLHFRFIEGEKNSVSHCFKNQTSKKNPTFWNYYHKMLNMWMLPRNAHFVSAEYWADRKCAFSLQNKMWHWRITLTMTEHEFFPTKKKR